MVRRMSIATGLCALLFIIGTVGSQVSAKGNEESKEHAKMAMPHKDHVLVTPDKFEWAPAPPGLPPGAQVAVLEGDPSKPGSFTMRFKMPAGYRIPAHFHPADEHVTVIEGTFFMGMGEKLDESALTELPTGSFAVMPKGSHHFAMAKDAVTVQLHGQGPWGITYVNPADDPRNAHTSK